MEILDFFIASASRARRVTQPGRAHVLPAADHHFCHLLFPVDPPANEARQGAQESWWNDLGNVGSEVVTNGGLLGRITNVGESFITVELADNVQIKVQRHAISNVMPKGTIKSA